MIERLDQQLFLLINSFNSPFWDQVMSVISGTVTWVPVYLAILIYLGVKLKRKFVVLILVIALAVTMSDQISVLIKNSVHRLRPCHQPELEGLVHLVKGYCGGLFGFVSSHASNSFMVATLCILMIRRRWFTWAMIFWAVIICYSRIYLGVHYPGDVICGSLLGIIVGWVIYRLYQYIDKTLLPKWKFFSPMK
jgi:undecaprenyl-diphosphatase